MSVSAPIDLHHLDATLDLWMCMWRPEEQVSFETALVRSMTDEHPRRTRLLALAACHVIATPRLLGAAARVAEAAVFRLDDIHEVEQATLSRHNLLKAATRMRGNVLGIELLLARVVAGAQDRSADALLEWVDVRDRVAVARTTVDARLFSEIEQRIGRRGRYQRGRAANVLGFTIRPQPAFATAGPGHWGDHSPEIGDLRRTGS